MPFRRSPSESGKTIPPPSAVVCPVTVSGCPHLHRADNPHTEHRHRLLGSTAHHAGALHTRPVLRHRSMYSSARHAHRCRACRYFLRRAPPHSCCACIVHRGRRGAEKMPARTLAQRSDRPVGDTARQDGAVTFHQAPFSVHAHRITAARGKPVLRQQLAASHPAAAAGWPYIHYAAVSVVWPGWQVGLLRCLGGRCHGAGVPITSAGRDAQPGQQQYCKGAKDLVS